MNAEPIVITLEKGFHHSNKVLLLHLPFDKDVFELIRQLPETRWSHSMKCWYGPRSKVFYEKLLNLRGTVIKIKTETEQQQEEEVNKYSDIQELEYADIEYDPDIELNEPFLRDIKEWADYLRSRQYAERSIRVYQTAVLLFKKWCGTKNHKELTIHDITDFMKWLVINRNVSRSYHNQVINALKSIYNHTLTLNFSSDMIERPRNEFRLPRYLTREEVNKVFQCIRNQKHKCLLSLIYACGLRVGEVIRIKLTDIDAAQRLLHVRQSKGAKDRTIPIPLSILNMLNDYAIAYQPKIYLFEGQDTGEAYSERSVQSIFKDAVLRSGIRQKDASPHWLRHSYATHIMEMGTNLRDIQALLGHKSLKTTELYTHISSTKFTRIISPFGTLDSQKEQPKLPGSDKNNYF